ncbi:MAG: TRL domain-containing protein [Arcobacteraceae bacterium]
MKKVLKYSLAGLAAMLLTTGCTHKASIGASNIDLSKVNMTQIENMKSGEACSSWFLIFPTGFDSTARQAAKNGGITTIQYQEYSQSNYLIAGSRCITVYGK